MLEPPTRSPRHRSPCAKQSGWSAGVGVWAPRLYKTRTPQAAAGLGPRSWLSERVGGKVLGRNPSRTSASPLPPFPESTRAAPPGTKDVPAPWRAQKTRSATGLQRPLKRLSGSVSAGRHKSSRPWGQRRRFDFPEECVGQTVAPEVSARCRKARGFAASPAAACPACAPNLASLVMDVR